MKNFDFLETNELIHRFTFKAMYLRDSYALLSVQNRQLAMRLVILWVESALFAVIFSIQIAVFRLIRGYYAHLQKEDCFECLSPHIKENDGVCCVSSTCVATLT